jgi:hypothetical protein
MNLIDPRCQLSRSGFRPKKAKVLIFKLGVRRFEENVLAEAVRAGPSIGAYIY